jgi:hypothetical protein
MMDTPLNQAHSRHLSMMGKRHGDQHYPSGHVWYNQNKYGRTLNATREGMYG